MTAIIGVLNKAAVALAADSAATVTGGPGKNKVYNYANKIFNLSSVHPVGITIYNTLDFMGIPWETVIKMYRKQLGSKSFKCLFQYAEDFLEYIKNIPNLESNLFLKAQGEELFIEVHNKTFELIHKDITETNFETLAGAEQIKVFNDYLGRVLRSEAERIEKKPILKNFAEYKLSDFNRNYSNEIKEVLDLIGGADKLSSQNLTLFSELVFLNVKHAFFKGSFTGIIVSGFGDDDYYPKMQSYITGTVVGGILRVSSEKDVTFVVEDTEQMINNTSATISVLNPSAVEGFAQKDIIDTFLKGIDPSISESINGFADFLFNSLQSRLSQTIADTNNKKELELVVNTIPDILENFKDKIKEVSLKNHESKIYTTIATLSKEDLAEMAEMLINLTYIKRRFSSDLESVGGPVDVAIITKTDGFIWVKRKLYFKPELNLNYVSGVFANRNSNP